MYTGLVSYTCHHLSATDRRSIVISHHKLFSNHYTITNGHPSCRSFSRFRSDSDSVVADAMQHFLQSRPTLLANWLLANQPLVDIRQLLSLVDQYISKIPDPSPQWLRPRLLSNAELSLSIKHRYALSHFLSSPQFKYALVLEDDALILPSSLSVVSELLEFLSDLSFSRAVYIDLSSGCNLSVVNLVPPIHKLSSGATLYSPVLPSSRTTCAYLINKPFAEAFLGEFIFPLAPIDYEYMFTLSNLQLEQALSACLWTEPHVFVHGSKDRSISSLI